MFFVASVDSVATPSGGHSPASTITTTANTAAPGGIEYHAKKVVQASSSEPPDKPSRRRGFPYCR